MVKLDLHEQEQLSKLTYFWRDYGRYIVGFLIVIIVAYVSNEIWETSIENQAKRASELYTNFTMAEKNLNTVELYKIAKELEQSTPKSQYATLASITAAKYAFSQKKYASAIDFLNWVINTSKDKGMVSIAVLRLADVYIDQKKFSEALKLLVDVSSNKSGAGTSEINASSDFAPLFYEKRGDLYLAKGDFNKARDAYQEVLKRASGDESIKRSVQLKLDLLGS